MQAIEQFFFIIIIHSIYIFLLYYAIHNKRANVKIFQIGYFFFKTNTIEIEFVFTFLIDQDDINSAIKG